MEEGDGERRKRGKEGKGTRRDGNEGRRRGRREGEQGGEEKEEEKSRMGGKSRR